MHKIQASYIQGTAQTSTNTNQLNQRMKSQRVNKTHKYVLYKVALYFGAAVQVYTAVFCFFFFQNESLCNTLDIRDVFDVVFFNNRVTHV